MIVNFPLSSPKAVKSITSRGGTAGEAEGSKRAVDIFESERTAGDLLVANTLYAIRRCIKPVAPVV